MWGLVGIPDDRFSRVAAQQGKMKPVDRKCKSLRMNILTESKDEGLCLKAVDRNSEFIDKHGFFSGKKHKILSVKLRPKQSLKYQIGKETNYKERMR